MPKDIFKIAFVSGRLGDVDGVSLEVDKWIKILSEIGHEIYTIAGYYRNPVANVSSERQILFEDIRFNSPVQKHIEELVFPYISGETISANLPTYFTKAKLEEIQSELETTGADVGNKFYKIIQKHKIDVIITENTNAMPMCLLGGIAVYRATNNYRVATIFHHHDFWWERSRFSQNHIEKLLNKIMPPMDIGTEHIVISSYASHILKSLKRINPHIIPNVENFDPPVTKDEWNKDIRKELGFSDDDILILQPTRIIPRKRIEDSIRLVGRFMEMNPELSPRVKFIISLYQGDESNESYIHNIKELANKQNVSLHLISDRIASQRGWNEKEEKLFSTRDILVHADLVTYLPIWEGFGNALMEAVACKVPITTTTYLVYKTDIQISGIRTIEIRDRYKKDGSLEIPDDIMDNIKRVFIDKEYRNTMVEHNFQIGKKEFGFERLRTDLNMILDGYADEIKASRRRLIKSMTTYSV